MKVADSFDFKLSFPIIQVLTQYTDNSNNSNSVINLIFLQANLVEIYNYFILPDLWSLSDHTPLSVGISIIEEFIQDKQQTIIKNSKEKEKFVNEFKNAISNINTSEIFNRKSLEEVVQEYTSISDSL